MSKQRSQKPKIDVTVVEEPTLATPVPEGTDPETLPFPEFSDQDINSEKWDASLPGKDKTLPASSKVLFEDPQEVHLPPGIAVHEWKRCSELYSNASFVVFSYSSEYPDLITPNHHLLNSEFYRSFISSIETLMYIGCTKPFPQEYDNPAFFTSGERSWRPWHHIYSNCKITKGEHSPAYNPAGKYVVRLFWLGTWRKIYVDDMMPVDISMGTLLLPSLNVPKITEQHSLVEIRPEKPAKGRSKGNSPVRKITIELWPMILCKALLKISSLGSWRNNTSHDFDIIHCLTGWIPQRIRTKDISASDLWDVFLGYVTHFKWAESKEGSVKKTGSAKTKSKGKEAATPHKGTKGVFPSGIESMRDGDRFLVMACNSFEPTEDSETPEDKKIFVFLSEVRDIPLIQPQPRPELEFWKSFRYEQWAVEQGIISPDIKKLNIKSLKIVDPFKRIFENVNQLLNTTTPTHDIDDKKSEKSSKSSKKTSKGGKAVLLEPDPSMWIDFCDIQESIRFLTIYFQPRCFKSKIKVSDINFSAKTTNFCHVISPFVLKETRNEPIYLFMDSIDYKILLINLTQMGDLSMLQKANEEDETEISLEKSDDLDICDQIVLWKTKNKKSSISLLEVGDNYLIDGSKNQSISLVLEEYCWESNLLGKSRGLINTLGTRSLMIDLKPGRVSLRLWISSHCSYVLQVFSDTPVAIGCLEEYLTACSVESQLLINLAYDLSSCYGKLVQSFGMPEHSISLRNFYHCYKPFEHLSKRDLATMHGVFFKEFCKIIADNSTIMNAVDFVKLLFLQLKTFDYINAYIEEPHLYPDKFSLDEHVEYAKLMQRSAVKIQAFFKSVYIRSLLKKMQENHKQYNGIFDTLKKVYTEIFSSDKRLTYCPTIIRRFFEREEMQPLNNKFELYHDIQSVLELYLFSGTLTVQESSWVPICRYQCYINSNEPVIIKINLFCNLKTFFIRVFNNDTQKEIKRATNDVMVEKYCANSQGYTVLCYGNSDNFTKVIWKLVLATRKMSRNDLIIVPNTLSTTLSLKDQYLPNFKNIICRYVIKLASDLILTANLTTSFDQVRICLRLLDKKGKVLREACGKESVLFPVLELKCDNQSRSDTSVYDSIQATQKRRVTAQSGISDITYSKLNSKCLASDSGSFRSSSFHKRSAGESDAGHKRHKKKNVVDMDADDATSVSSQRSEQDTDGKNHGRKIQNKTGSSETNSRRELASVTLNKCVKNTLQTAPVDGWLFGENLETRVKTSKELERSSQDLNPEIWIYNKMHDSWPLTADEWKRVQKLKEKSNLNLLEERGSLGKRQKKISLTINEPYWILDLIYVPGNGIEFEQDHSQSERRKEIKRKWFDNIDTYKRGLTLRETYLQEHSVERKDPLVDTNKRSNDAKDFATKIVGEDSLEKYMIRPLKEVDEDSCYTKRDDDYIIEEANTEHQMHEYKTDEAVTQEEIESQLQEQKDNFIVLSKWFDEIRSDSLEMLTEAQTIEKDYFKRASKSSNKGKGDKNNKEKKKK